MPDRVVRQDILTSDAVNNLSWPAEVFYRRLMSIADDFGRYEANTSLLRAFLYPKKIDKVSEPDVVKWLGECSKAGLIRCYQVDGKDYLQIQKFGQRLRAMRSRYPEPPSADTVRHPPSYVSGPPPETKRIESETESESENETDTPAGVGGPAAPPDPHEIFKGLEKNKKSLYSFIRTHRPDFIEPYVELWNLFAGERSKAQIAKISDARRKKFKTRISEKAFDFLKILEKAGKAGDFLSTSKWFTWDWIFESENNYLKVLEGNYDKGDKPAGAAATQATEQDLDYLLQRYLEDRLDSKVITESHCNFLLEEGLIQLEERFINQAVDIRVKNLTGTNVASELRMITAYQAGTWPADPDCRADTANRERIAKKFALFNLFKVCKQLQALSIAELRQKLSDAPTL